MTRPRIDKHSTEFGLWLRNVDKEGNKIREVDPIDSFLGYTAYNIDYIWRYENKRNKKPMNYMNIEEKRGYNRGFRPIKKGQKRTFSIIDKACKKDKNYCGFYCLYFSNTNPEDGKIYLTNFNEDKLPTKEDRISKDELFKFLQFKYPIKNTLKWIKSFRK